MGPTRKSIGPAIEAVSPLSARPDSLLDSRLTSSPTVKAVGPAIEAIGPRSEVRPTVKAVGPAIKAVRPTVEALAPALCICAITHTAIGPAIEAVGPTVKAIRPTVKAIRPAIEAVGPTVKAIRPTIEAAPPIRRPLSPSLVPIGPTVEAAIPGSEPIDDPIQAPADDLELPHLSIERRPTLVMLLTCQVAGQIHALIGFTFQGAQYSITGPNSPGSLFPDTVGCLECRLTELWSCGLNQTILHLIRCQLRMV